MPGLVQQLDLPATCHTNTRVLFDYWLGKCGKRRMPARSDLDPTEIPQALLPSVCLVEVVPDARRYVYRLVGTADVEVRGNDPTGKSVTEGFFGSLAHSVLASYDSVVVNRAPFLDLTHVKDSTGRYLTEEKLFLPLSSDGVNVNKILVFSQSRELRRSAPEQTAHLFDFSLDVFHN